MLLNVIFMIQLGLPNASFQVEEMDTTSKSLIGLPPLSSDNNRFEGLFQDHNLLRLAVQAYMEAIES